jgi:hypothetical protein
VELGKQLATKTEAVLGGTAPVPEATDASTRDLVARVTRALGAR